MNTTVSPKRHKKYWARYDQNGFIGRRPLLERIVNTVMKRLVPGFHFEWWPLEWCWFVFSFPSKTYDRIIIFVGGCAICATNNWSGQLNGYVHCILDFDGFWKHGPRFTWQTQRP